MGERLVTLAANVCGTIVDNRRYYLLLLIVALLTSCTPAEVYVSPEGSDANAGSLEAPYATLARALRGIKPGTTIFLRGGTLKPTIEQCMGHALLDQYLCVYKLAVSGSETRPITIRSYPGERCQIDLSLVKPDDQRVCGFFIAGDNWVLEDFDIVGVQVTQRGHTQSENILVQGGCRCQLRRLRIHDSMGVGINLKEGHDNLVENCDVWNNYDAVSEEGDGHATDGFGAHLNKPGSTGNVFRGCRAWRNSGDGFDLTNCRQAVTLETCWAWQNGYDAQMNGQGGGMGFRAGGFGKPKCALPGNVPRNRLLHCIAWANRKDGFCANHHPGGLDMLDCRAMGNKTNFNLVCQRSMGDAADVAGYDHLLQNCVSHNAGRALVRNINQAKCNIVDSHLGLDGLLADSDFLSLDPDLLRGERQPNGDLPDVAFLKLRK